MIAPLAIIVARASDSEHPCIPLITSRQLFPLALFLFIFCAGVYPQGIQLQVYLPGDSTPWNRRDPNVLPHRNRTCLPFPTMNPLAVHQRQLPVAENPLVAGVAGLRLSEAPFELKEGPMRWLSHESSLNN